VQSGPQAQIPPQRHPERRSFCAAWQPQVQVAPAHDSQAQAFGVVVFFITSSLEGGWPTGRRTVESEPALCETPRDTSHSVLWFGDAWLGECGQECDA
jgi:hypothetical protein